ncbi:MAG: hypothetical protein E6H09_06840 [Bacteroidetes bacterium]|jgi:hypothetical protein|nr:MAG: hypothetical protein E6H09_06840 [Bacteroidota bacterium]
MRRIVVIIFTLSVANSYGQTFDWWAQLVHWDGVSEWPKYMITQPAYMGPNALPVPRIGNGSIDSSFSIAATGSLHFSKGDNTQNFTIYANYCLVKNVISFDASWIPYEHFTMSHAIKEQRHVFSHFYYDQQATGDIELNTTIQLLNRWRKDIQLALRIGYRFPTGTGLGVARYTDGPGYHFDLSFGKPVNTSLKWIGMLGFYSWQLINVGRRQDDAFLFGTGAEWNTKRVRLQTYVAGYLGYQLNSGDKPVVFRTTVEKKIKRTSFLLGFQQGLHDFKYSSIEVGTKFRFQ